MEEICCRPEMEDTTEMEGVRQPSPMSMHVARSTRISSSRWAARLFCSPRVTCAQGGRPGAHLPLVTRGAWRTAAADPWLMVACAAHAAGRGRQVAFALIRAVFCVGSGWPGNAAQHAPGPPLWKFLPPWAATGKVQIGAQHPSTTHQRHLLCIPKQAACT